MQTWVIDHRGPTGAGSLVSLPADSRLRVVLQLVCSHRPSPGGTNCCRGHMKLTPVDGRKLTPSRDPARAEPGRNGVLSVEDWAEIRRPYRPEGLPIKQIGRVLGVPKNTVK